MKKQGSFSREFKREAFEFAKNFYNQMLIPQTQGETLHTTLTFRKVALLMLDEMDNQVKRDEITQQTAQMARLRLNKSVFNKMNKLEVAGQV